MRDDVNRGPFELGTGAGRRRRGLGKIFGIVCVLGALLAGVFLFVLKTRDVQRVPPHVIGNVWTAAGGEGKTSVYFVTREDRAVTRSYDPQGRYTYDHTYSVYRLHARAAADGSPAGEVELARIDTTSVDFKRYQAFRTLPDGPGILGPQGDVLWVWNGGPEARDARTLGVVWKGADLKGGADGPTLPDDPKYFKVLWGVGEAAGVEKDRDRGVPVFKSPDARYFRIDREAGVCVAMDEAKMAPLSRAHTKTADTAFESMGPSPWGPGGVSLGSTSVSGLVHNEVFEDGVWRAMLTADERAGLNSRVGILEEWSIRQALVAENARALYSAAVTMDPSRVMPRTSMMIDPAKVERKSPESERYLAGGFLRRAGTPEAWVTGAGGGEGRERAYIILHRKAIGEKSPWMLTRLGADGVRAWTTELGLTELDELSDGGTSVVILGRERNERPQNEWPERMVFVDEGTGKMGVVDVAKGEMVAP